MYSVHNLNHCKQFFIHLFEEIFCNVLLASPTETHNPQQLGFLLSYRGQVFLSASRILLLDMAAAEQNNNVTVHKYIVLGLHHVNSIGFTYFKSQVILNSKFVLQSFTISYFRLFSISRVPYMCMCVVSFSFHTTYNSHIILTFTLFYIDFLFIFEQCRDTCNCK